MFTWLKTFFSRIFSSPVVAKIAIARILANNPKEARLISSAAELALTTLPSQINAVGLEYLLRKKAGYTMLLPEEQVLFDEVMAAVKLDLESRGEITFDAVPLLTWLSKQGGK